MNILAYLATYDYVFEAEFENYKNNFETNYIWQCWLQGRASMPKMVEACMQTVQAQHGDFKLKFLHLDNVQDFIKIPNYILRKYSKGQILPAHFSDYIRVCLLAKYGGTWIDSTIYLTDKIPAAIFQQDFFAFKFPPWCELNKLPSVDEVFSESVREIDRRCFSNWFMHAKCDNRLMKIIKLMLEEYWSKENSAFDYYIFHIFSTYAVLKDKECAKIFNNMLELNNAYPHLLQQCLQREYNENLFNNIKNSTPIHKLMHKISDNMNENSFAHHLIHGQ